MSSRKVQVLLPSIFPLRSPVYAGRFFPIARELAPGYDFTILVKHDPTLKSMDETNIGQVPANVRLVEFKSWRALVRLTWRLAAQHDILFPCKPFSVTGLNCHLIWRLRGTPVVQDTDDLEGVNIQWYYPQEIPIERFLMRAARHVSAASRGLLRYWRQAEYVPNTARLELFDPAKADRERTTRATRQKRDFGERPVLLWVAGGGPVDVVFPLRLFEPVHRLLPQAILAVVGERPDLARLRRAAAASPAAPAVRFLGRIPTDELTAMYLTADAHLLSLRDHPYDACKCPGRLGESMAMEAPLVVTDVGEPAYVVRECGCGIAVPCEPARAAAPIAEFLARPRAELRAIGQRGRAYLEQHRNWPQIVRPLDALFRRALADRPATPGRSS